MMRKLKKIIPLVLGGLLAAAGTCLAHIPLEEFAIGGITLYSKPDQIKAIYGTPTQETKQQITIYKYTLPGLYMIYGNSFKMVMTDPYRNGDYFMYTIETTANNGLGTPAGLMVGDSFEKALALYGMPNATWSGKKDYRYHVTQQDLNEVRKGNKWAIYNSGHASSLIIKVKKGKIISLKLINTAE
ncbi:hypothetical protein [Acidaminococcus sp.]|uniref:hypothetical protein n=1 Tax=Acidaminococcus sp. TaxID=1872103 RepID=UPI003D7D7255